MTTKELEYNVACYFDYRKNIIIPNVSWGFGIHECDLLIVKQGLEMIETEYAELEKKLNELNEFNASEKANEINPIQKVLLRIQAGAMYTYLECLKGRLDRL